jgi:replication-associated recombination protein RarA
MIQDLLLSSAAKPHLANAYLFHGPDEATLKKYARLFAQTAIGSGLENNPDFIFFSPEKTTKVDDIRSLQEQTKYGPNNGSKMIVVVEYAEKITTEASNAFLKTLETPPEGVSFILLTTHLPSILKTIQSRSQSLFIPNETEKEIPEGIIEFNTFLSKPLVQRMDYMIDLAKDKDLAKEQLYIWLDNTIQTPSNVKHNSKAIIDTLQKLEYNVNLRLQLEAFCMAV